MMTGGIGGSPHAAVEPNDAGRPTDLTADVVVVGAGCAGLSAAVRLAAAGCRVAVVEEAPRLGGRASTFVDPATGERVDNGQHVLFGCYRHTYDFLTRIGTAALAPLDRALTITMAGTDGRARRLSCPPLPPPWHLVAGVLKWGAMPVRDRLSALKLASPLRRLRRRGSRTERDADVATVAEWLRAHGQSPELCRWLWHPLAVAALNQQPDIAAATPFLQVLAELFGPRRDDSAVGLPIVPLDELYALPAARLIEQRGGTVITGAPAKIALDRSGRIPAVRAGTRRRSQPARSSAPCHGMPWRGSGRAHSRAVSCGRSSMRAPGRTPRPSSRRTSGSIGRSCASGSSV